MHERYIFNGLVFTIACVPFARRYLWGAIALTVVLFCESCGYRTLEYLRVVSNNAVGLNTANLWGPWTTVLSLAMVGTFFVLGYQYLGTTEAKTAKASQGARAAGSIRAKAWR